MDKSMPTAYPIRTTARMTGLTVDTLRAWERRYRAVVPERGERGRAYTDQQIERLKRLAALVADGHAIGTIAALPDAGLRKLARADVRPGAARPRPAGLEPLLAAVKAYDLPSIEAELSRHAVLLPPVDLIFAVILPVLTAIGSRWQTGAIRPAHEHLLSGIIRGVLGGVLRAMARPSHSSRIVFATPQCERHELGLLCGAVLAAVAGHHVIYLGPDLPAADIAHAVRQSHSRTLILASTADAAGTAADLSKVARLPRSVSILLGGPRAASLRHAIGPRARVVEDLDALRRLLERQER
jgi:hypothetical protein